MNKLEENYFKYEVWAFDEKEGNLLNYEKCSFFYRPKIEFKQIYSNTYNLYNLIDYQEYKFTDVRYIDNQDTLKEYFKDRTYFNCGIDIYDPYFNKNSLDNILNIICECGNNFNYYCNSKTKDKKINEEIKKFYNEEQRKYFNLINIFKIKNQKFHDRYVCIKNNNSYTILSITNSVNNLHNIKDRYGITISEYDKIYNDQLLEKFNEFKANSQKIGTIKYQEKLEKIDLEIPEDLLEIIKNDKHCIEKFNKINFNIEINREVFDYIYNSLIKFNINEIDYNYFRDLLINRINRDIQLFNNIDLNDFLLDLYKNNTKQFENCFLKSNNKEFKVFFFLALFSKTMLFNYLDLIDILIKSKILFFRCVSYYYLFQIPNLFKVKTMKELINYILNINNKISDKELLFLYLVFLFENNNVKECSTYEGKYFEETISYFKDSKFKNLLDENIIKNFKLSYQIDIIYRLTQFLGKEQKQKIEKYYIDMLEKQDFINVHKTSICKNNIELIFFDKFQIKYLESLIKFYNKKSFLKYKQKLIDNIENYFKKIDNNQLLLASSYYEYYNNLALILINYLILLKLNNKFKKIKNIISINKISKIYKKVFALGCDYNYVNSIYKELIFEIDKYINIDYKNLLRTIKK